jgi:AraC family transcriptional regulator
MTFDKLGLCAGSQPVALDERRWRYAEHAYTDEPIDAVPAEQIRCSSKGRPWHGISVWHQIAGNDDLYIPASGKHCIIVRKGASTGLVQRHGAVTRVTRWNTGDIVLLPERTPSFWRTELPRDNLHLDLSTQWLERVEDAGPGAVALRSCFGVRDPVLQQMVQLLLLALDDNSSLQPSFADGIATSVAVHLLEHYRATGMSSPRVAPLSARELRRIADLVNAHLAQPLPIAALAAEVGLSVFHFSRCFKATCGVTPHQYVLSLRLDYARMLLLESKQPVRDIASAAGFRSFSHFSQAFRRHWGALPSQFRRGQ